MHDRGLKPKDAGLTEESNFCEAKPASNRRSDRLHSRSIHVLRIAALIAILVRYTVEIGHVVDGPLLPIQLEVEAERPEFGFAPAGGEN